MNNKLKIIIMAFCSFLAIGFDYVKYLDSDEVIKGIYGCLKTGYLGSIIIFLLFIKVFSKKIPIKHWVINILSFLLAVFMIMGASYMKYETSVLIFADYYKFLVCLIVGAGYFFIFKLIISYIYNYLDKGKIKDFTNKVIVFYKRHPLIISFLIIILCWIPYFIAYYPIILSPDPSFQIKQLFGIRTKYADYSLLLDENVVLTNHHPVFHTLILGSCLKLGTLIGNDNLGLFFYSLLQIFILALILSYTIKYIICDMKLPVLVGLGALGIYSLVPMYGMYAISAVKDVYFSAFMILYILFFHKILMSQKERIAIKDIVKLILISLLLILFRNNGIHIILLTLPFLILAKKKYYKQLGLSLIIILVLTTSYFKVLLPAFKITPGSIRETLSIPFQQTARYVKYYGEELSDEDKSKIDKVLVFDSLKDRYNPELSDPVKNEYNKYATKEDLKAYLMVWFKCFFKHPLVYVDATINNVYGYFYPEKTSSYLHTGFDSRIVADGFNYHYNNLEDYREKIADYVNYYPNIPIIGLLTNIGFSTWIVFILVGYFVKKKEYKKIVLYLPALISILVCIASPANSYFRYAMPYVFALPLMISFSIEKKNIV